MHSNMVHSQELSDSFDHLKYRQISYKNREKVTRLIEQTLDSLIAIVRPELICEIGAHEAQFSLRMKERYPSSRVVAIEANPRVYEHFKPKLDNTGVEYVHGAIDSQNGSVPFHIPDLVAGRKMPYTGRLGSLRKIQLRNSECSSVTLEAQTLDELLASEANRRNVLWIEVDGAADRVLEGAVQTLKSSQIVFCELESAPVWEDQALDINIIQQLGKENFVLAARDCHQWFQYNAIFVKEDFLANPDAQSVLAEYKNSALKTWWDIVERAQINS